MQELKIPILDIFRKLALILTLPDRIEKITQREKRNGTTPVPPRKDKHISKQISLV